MEAKAIDLKQNEIEITFEELLQHTFCPGYVYLKKKYGKPIKLISPGELIQFDFVQKFKESAERISIDTVTTPINIHRAVELFNEYRTCRNIIEQLEVREKIICWFADGYWRGIEDASLLDFIIIGERFFLNSSPNLFSEMNKLGPALLQRSMLGASLGVLLSIVHGITDWNFLRDVYHAICLQDFDYGPLMTSSVLKYYESVREGSMNLDLSKLMPFEKEIIKNHHSVEQLKQKIDINDIFADSANLALVNCHHERMNGNGGPKKIKENELSDLECIIIFCSNIFPYNDIEYARFDGKGFLKKVFQAEIDNYIGIKIKNMISGCLNKSMTLKEHLEKLKNSNE